MSGERISSKIGQAVEHEVPEVEPAPPAPPIVKPEDEVWEDAPTVFNQEERYPGSVKLDYPHTEIYNLALPADLEKYNKRIESSFGKAPTCRIYSSQVVRSTTSWEALVVSQAIRYKKIISTSNDLKTDNKQ